MNSPSAKESTETESPNLTSVSKSLNSTTLYLGVVLAFLK